MRGKLLSKFIVSLGILGLILTVTITGFNYHHMKISMEDLYADKVVNGSKLIARMLPVEDVKKIISKEGNHTPEYQEMCNLLNSIKKDCEITFLSLVVPEEDSITFYIDAYMEGMTDNKNLPITYGTNIKYENIARDEEELRLYNNLWKLYKENKGSVRPFVTDNEYGYNYTAVFPVLDNNGDAIAEIQYIMDMKEVKGYLTAFLVQMLSISFFIISIATLCYIFFVKKTIVHPIVKLVEFTDSISYTEDFGDKRIKLHTHDEIQELAEEFNFMLSKLDSYIENFKNLTLEREKIVAELDVAKNIQESMLPCIFPAFPKRPDFDIYASMQPAKKVGGDFYDFFLIDDDHLVMVIADVSGKGVPAALFMMITKSLIKNAAQLGFSPKPLFEKVNNQLCENNEAEMFVTAWIGKIELSTGKMTCVNAGHEQPIIRRKNGLYENYKDKHGFVLAGMKNIRYQEYEIILNPGDAILVYTDGVPEAINMDDEFYGKDRLINVLNAHGDMECKDIIDTIKKDMRKFVGEASQFDDITMLCLEINDINSGIIRKINMVPSKKNLSKAIAFFERTCGEENVPSKIISQICLVVDEIFTNIVEYSGATTVTLGCEIKEHKVIIRFSDNGRPYDPTQKEDPDITLSVEDREVGGLGIYIVKKLMDKFIYGYQEEFNVLILEKSW